MKLSLTPEVLTSPTAPGHRLPREYDHSLPTGVALCGSLPALQQLRLQINIVSRHLRTAVLEIEPGLGDQEIAEEMAHLSLQDGLPLLTVEAAALNDVVAERGLIGAHHLLDTGNPRVVYLRDLSLLSPLAQRCVSQLLSGPSRRTRWIFSTPIPLRTLRVRCMLLPELLRCLSTIALRVPPLRERLATLPELAALLLGTIAEARDVPTPVLSADAAHLLSSHAWHNNLAELYTVLRTSTRVHPGPVLEASQLRPYLEASPLAPGAHTSAAAHPALLPAALPSPAVPLPIAGAQSSQSMRLEDVVDQHLLFVLARCSGNKLRAAEVLHISRSTLYRMLEAIAKRQQNHSN